MAVTRKYRTPLPMKPSNEELFLKVKSYLKGKGHHGWAVWSVDDGGWCFTFTANKTLVADVEHMLRYYDHDAAKNT